MSLIKNPITIFVAIVYFCMIILVSNINVVAQSTPEENRRSIIERTEWYDPNEVYAVCDEGTVTLQGKDNIEKIWNFFSDSSKNLKDYQIAGIMGNMAKETGGTFHPNTTQPSTRKTAEEYVALGWDNAPGHAYGIVQWDRGSKLTSNAVPLSKANSIEFQLNFLWEQLNGRGPVPENRQILEQIRSTNTVEEAVLAFQGNTNVGGKYIGFERPADQSGSVPDRVASAKSILNDYQGKSSLGIGIGDDCSLGVVTGSFNELVLAYAWPDYRKAPYLEVTKAYATAVIEAEKRGEYIGGTVGGVKGIDCGGFVTRLVINSNLDPGYNYNGKGGNTISQEQWLRENWQQINPSSSADHKPGDVAINATHTYIYVGDIDGFESSTASASFSTRGNGRAPMAGSERPADSNYRWYRKE